jgi:hypothetical protein
MVKILNYASPEIEEQYKAQEDEDKPVVDTAEDTAVEEPKQQQPAVKGPRILRRAGEDTVAPISPQETLIAPAAQPSAPTGPSVPTGVTAEDIAAEEEKQKAEELEAIDPTIDYEAADAETDMPTPADMAREQMQKLGLAIPDVKIDLNTRVGRARKDNADTAETIAGGAAEQGMSEYEFIRDIVVPSMPDKVDANGDEDENGSPSLMKKFMSTPVLGPVFMQSLINVGGAINVGTAAYNDFIDDAVTSLAENNPDTYEDVSKFVFGGKVGKDTFVKKLMRESENTLTMLEGIPALGTGAKLGGDFKQAAKQVEKESRRLNIQMAKAMTQRQADEKAALAKDVAAQNKQITTDYIKEFEQKIGARSKLDINDIIDEKKLISTEKNGQLVIDEKKARAVGKQKLEDIDGEPINLLNMAEGEDKVSDFLDLAGDTLTINVIRPEKLDAFTAAAADIIAKKPELYNPKKRLVDNLFDMSVNQEVVQTDELLELLNKYDLSYEDYATMVLGSASDAGRVLQKFSQLSKRIKPKGEIDNIRNAALLDNQNSIMKFIRRTENIRRGLLVSQIATAARNLSSAGIRAPLEGLQNVMDTALYNMGQEGIGAGAKSLVSKANWNDSFRHMRYMTNPKNMSEVKGYTDFILSRPGMSEQFDMMYNQINEVRRATGAGSGGKLDKALTFIEDGVDVLNTPNRWQEYLVRRGSFLAELERLSKNEYGIDLIETINAGKLNDLLNDAPDIIGDKRPFKQLVADATEKALDITYAKQPDTEVFRNITSFITNNGLTVITPFPRFMFNSMELFGNYAGGAAAPLLRKATSMFVKDKRGPLTAKERKQLSRNMIGVGAILPAAMMYRGQEDAPTDYKMLRTDDDTLMDTTPQSPILRQALWIAEAAKRYDDGTLSNWYDHKDAKETFLGVNVRTGAGDAVFNDIAKMIETADAQSGETIGSTFGTIFGEYASTYFTPLNQVIDAQRGTGERSAEYRDVREEPMLGETGVETAVESFKREFAEPFARRGYSTLLSPEEDEKLPLTETLFQKGETRERVMPLLKVFTGIGLSKESSEAGKFLEKLGFRDYKMRTKTISPGFQRYETKVLRELLPTMVDVVTSPEFMRIYRTEARKRNAEERDRKSDDAFIKDEQTRRITEILADYKAAIDPVITGSEETGIVDPKSGNPIDVRLQGYLEAQQKLRRMKPAERRAARNALPNILQEVGRGDEKPSFANEDHIRMMLEYIKETKL